MNCAHCGHDQVEHREGVGSCSHQIRGRQYGEDDYCECQAFVAREPVYHQVTEGVSVEGYVHADATYEISLKLPRSMSTGDALWLSDRLKDVAEVI